MDILLDTKIIVIIKNIRIFDMENPDYKKITQILNYIAEKQGGKVDYMKALKLLYLADRLHLRKYGRLITDDRLIAMTHGTLGSQAKDIAVKSDFLPHVVYQYVDDKLKRDSKEYTIAVNNKERDQISETDFECVDKVLSVVGNKKPFDLVKIVHELPEWKRWQYVLEEEKEKSVVDLDLSDLFKPVNDEILGKIYSQSPEELDLSHSFFSDSLEQKEIFA